MIVTPEEFKMIEYALRSVERECEKEIKECKDHQTQFAEYLSKKKAEHMRLRLKIVAAAREQHVDGGTNEYTL